ncbi:hypothetical protein R4J03_14745 [Brachyspira intermedia]|uniref:hypothetical protein n=1 Tax=Brachyspira intermedia TaxID=84377 RepID=UPI0026072284|nr:hypothetical protein [uncultured Brachyspira sp.]
MKPVTVQGCTLTTDNATAQATIIDTPSMKVKAESKGVYKTPLTVQVIGATQGNFAQTAPSTGTIESTAQKVKAENILVILEGDKTNTPVQCPATDPSTGATTTISVTVTVQTAGQTKVMGA